MRVAILGCGPAGLIAAYAVESQGHDPYLFSMRKRQSEMFGAQYLHEPIPGIDAGPAQRITYSLLGTAEGYREKVYGKDYTGTVSPLALKPEHDAYDIRRTYDALWEVYGRWVREEYVNDGWLRDNLMNFGLVISTIPAPSICRSFSHVFWNQGIWAYGDAPARGQYAPVDLKDGAVVCNGLPDPAWYRASRIFGHATLEWSQQGDLPLDLRVSAVKKPLKTDCDCWPGVVRLGRYGKWRKGYLVHQVYQDTLECLASRV
jgi:hypothetical protein